MSFDIAVTLRRLKPQRVHGSLERRSEDELSFVAGSAAAGPALLLDTTVYIDTLQKRLPEEVRSLLAARRVNHSSVALAELAHAFGRLDPADPRTAATLGKIETAIATIPARRLTAPSVQALIEAGIVTGAIARLRGLPAIDRQPLLNDATLFMQALEGGAVLLTRNFADLDLVQQLVPAGRVLFYRRAA